MLLSLQFMAIGELRKADTIATCRHDLESFFLLRSAMDVRASKVANGVFIAIDLKRVG